MTQPLRSQAQVLADMQATLSQSLGVPVVLSPGDTVLGMFDAVKVQFDRIQSAIYQATLLARAQTSSGPDLDSFYAQFGFYRLKATPPQGLETFGRNTPAASVISVSPGTTIVQTSDGTIQYQVVGDTTQPNWNATAGAYQLPIGGLTMPVTVQGIISAGGTSGSSLRVAAGALNTLAAQVGGIDFVTNPNAISNGFDQETDAAFRARFPTYLATLGEATEAAILFAVENVQSGLAVDLLENENAAGLPQLGTFTTLVDDGSHNPSSSLLAACLAAANKSRAFTVEAQARGPAQAPLAIATNVHLANGTVVTSAISAVQSAIASYVNSVGDGATVYISGVESAALSVGSVVAVQPNSTTINGQAVDFTPSAIGVAVSSPSAISVGTY